MAKELKKYSPASGYYVPDYINRPFDAMLASLKPPPPEKDTSILTPTLDLPREQYDKERAIRDWYNKKFGANVQIGYGGKGYLRNANAEYYQPYNNDSETIRYYTPNMAEQNGWRLPGVSTVAHELGHSFDYRTGGIRDEDMTEYGSRYMARALPNDWIGGEVYGAGIQDLYNNKDVQGYENKFKEKDELYRKLLNDLRTVQLKISAPKKDYGDIDLRNPGDAWYYMRKMKAPFLDAGKYYIPESEKFKKEPLEYQIKVKEFATRLNNNIAKTQDETERRNLLTQEEDILAKLSPYWVVQKTYGAPWVPNKWDLLSQENRARPFMPLDIKADVLKMPLKPKQPVRKYDK